MQIGKHSPSFEPGVMSTAFLHFLISLLGKTRAGLGAEFLVGNSWNVEPRFDGVSSPLFVLTGADFCHFR